MILFDIKKKEPNTQFPDWMNPEEIAKHAPKLQGQLPKLASSAEDGEYVKSYVCTSCKKTYSSESQFINEQRALQKVSFVPLICTCGEKLEPYEVLPILKKESSALPPYFEAPKNVTYNSFVNRLLYLKAIDALSSFASKMGFKNNVVRYLRSEHVGSAAHINNINCEIQVPLGKGKISVFASISIDKNGKFIFPQVFKTIDNKEIPFEPESVEKFLKNAAFEPEPALDPVFQEKKSDTLHYRPPDVFHIHTAQAIPPANRAPAGFTPGTRVKDPVRNKIYIVDSVTESGDIVLKDTTNPSSVQVVRKENASGLVRTSSTEEEVCQIIDDAMRKIKTRTHKKGNANIGNERRKWVAKLAQLKEETKRRKHGLPIRENKDIEIGMTEFPKGQKKEDSTGHPLSNDRGYRIPFSKMDEEQVNQREKFENLQYLPVRSMPLKHFFEQYLSLKERKILSSIIDKFSADPLEEEALTPKPEPEISPVTLKDLKRAPSNFEIPSQINAPTPELEKLLKDFETVSGKLQKITAKIEEIRASYLQEMEKSISRHLSKEESARKDLALVIEMIYNELLKFDSKITWYKDYLYAAQSVVKEVGRPASLTEVINAAKQFHPEVVSIIEELRDMIEKDRIRQVIERYLTRFPISKDKMKRLESTSALEGPDQLEVSSVIEELYDWILKAENLLEKYYV